MSTLEGTVKKSLSSLAKDTDYADVRFGESDGTVVVVRNKRVEEVSKPNSFGGCVRVLTKDGWGLSTFSEIAQIPFAFKEASRFAKLVGKGKSNIYVAAPIIDQVLLPQENREFERQSTKNKVELVKYYDEVAWQKKLGIANVNVTYSDSMKKTWFFSSEGSQIYQEKGFVYSMLTVTAKYKDVIQRYSLKLSDSDFKMMLNRDEEVRKTVETAKLIARAPAAKSGMYTVVIDPSLAGVFAHEAFGHLSEGDNTYENPQLEKVMKLGREFGSPELTIIDDPTLPGLRGSYKYDDEGVPAQKTVLLERGRLVGRLHSRETAKKMNETANGHGRAQSSSVRPLVRMGITYIEAGRSTFEEMISGIGDGIYCINWQGGNTDHERFTFTAGYGRLIRNGKLGKVVRDVKLTGNLFETLKNVDMVGNDLRFEGGNCGKGGQWVPENSGGPHIRIKDLMVMGV